MEVFLIIGRLTCPIHVTHIGSQLNFELPELHKDVNQRRVNGGSNERWSLSEVPDADIADASTTTRSLLEVLSALWTVCMGR